MATKVFNVCVVFMVLVMTACNSTKTQQAISNTTHSSATNGNDGHNSRNALDWKGMYSGTLPCADCEGIKTDIELKDSTYVMKTKYLGKSEKMFLQIGNFLWNDMGNIITLINNKEDSNQYWVGENTLTLLDKNGNRITGRLAQQYILDKIVIVDIKSKNNLINQSFNMIDTKWQLIELKGAPVKQNNFYLQFTTDSTFAAFAGCNGIGGKFHMKPLNKFSFYNLQSTLKACSEMQHEINLVEALNKTDNYTLKNNILSLNKAKMSPLAVFKLIEK